MPRPSCRHCETIRRCLELTEDDEALEHVCHDVDVDLIELVPSYVDTPGPHYLDEAVAMCRRIARNWTAAQTFVESEDLPDLPGDFLEYMTEVHRRLFDGTHLTFGGRFRHPGEHSAPMGPYGRQLPTSPAEHIEARLRRLHRTRIRPAEVGPPVFGTKEALAHNCAQVLHDFFAIHPFVDGNGRTGRLLLVAIASKRSPFRFRALDVRVDGTAKEQGTEYIRALQRVDEELEQQARGGTGPGDAARAYDPLAEWLAALLVEATTDDEPPT